MDFTSVPIIVFCCYIIGEIYKVIFKKRQNLYKLIPILVTLLGGLLGILIYLTEPTMIEAKNIYYALEMGLISGASSTGVNQIVKLLKGDNQNEKESSL